MMDSLAEKLSELFGSTAFILSHAGWFLLWILAHLTLGFDDHYSLLTVIVSLEAIFLSLFILRAETIQSKRFEKQVTKDIETSKQTHKDIKQVKRKLK